MESANRILLILTHPALHKSRVNKSLIKEVTNLDGVTIHDLYSNYPDHHIHVKREQELLSQHKIIVWQHPFYWYSAPAMLKEWIDLVLQHGWAYGRNGTNLKDKKLLSVITTGGGEQAYAEGGYNGFTINQFLLPYQQTAKLCKMTYLPPFVVHGTHLLEDTGINKYATQYRKLLIALRDNIFDDKQLSENSYRNLLIK